MIEVDDKELIRRAYLLDGQSERQIAKERKHSRNSVAAVVADPKTATYDLTQVELDLEGTLVGLATVVTLREQHQLHRQLEAIADLTVALDALHQQVEDREARRVTQHFERVRQFSGSGYLVHSKASISSAENKSTMVESYPYSPFWHATN